MKSYSVLVNSLIGAGICLSILSPGAESRLLSAVRKGPWHHEIVEGPHPDALVSATFNNTINQTG